MPSACSASKRFTPTHYLACSTCLWPLTRHACSPNKHLHGQCAEQCPQIAMRCQPTCCQRSTGNTPGRAHRLGQLQANTVTPRPTKAGCKHADGKCMAMNVMCATVSDSRHLSENMRSRKPTTTDPGEDENSRLDPRYRRQHKGGHTPYAHKLPYCQQTTIPMGELFGRHFCTARRHTPNALVLHPNSQPTSSQTSQTARPSTAQSTQVSLYATSVKCFWYATS